MYTAEQCGVFCSRSDSLCGSLLVAQASRRKIDGSLLRRREIFAQIDFARMRRVIRIGLFITFCWVLSGNTASSVDPQRVVELLKSVAANQPSVAKEPAPQAYVVNFASGAVNFHLRVWTERFRGLGPGAE